MKRFAYTVELHEAVWEVGGLLVLKQHWFNTYEEALKRYKSMIENTRNVGKIAILNEIIYHVTNESKKVYEYSVFSSLIV